MTRFLRMAAVLAPVVRAPVFGLPVFGLPVFGLMMGALLAGGATPALAGDLPIFTASDSGSYQTRLCPPLVDYIEGQQQFLSLACTPSAGSGDNYTLVQDEPGALALAQFDVVARLLAAETTPPPPVDIVQQTGVRECVFAVTNAKKALTWKDVRDAAAIVPFLLPPEGSGSAATFAFMRELHPNDLGLASSNITYEADTMAMLRALVDTDRTSVGLFVQFPDLGSEAFKFITEHGLRVLGVGSREMARAQVEGRNVYTAQQIVTAEGGWFSKAKTVGTMCTETVVIAAAPQAVTDPGAGQRLKLVTEALKGFDMAKVAAQDGRGWLERMLSAAKAYTGSAASEVIEGFEKAGDGLL